jgi:hypothetical protein
MKIASRTLKLSDQSRETRIRIDIFAPERDGNAWKCRYQIGWPENTWSSYGAGIDAVQALVIAMQKIAAEIYFSEYHKSGKLFWESRAKGYGFPVTPAMRDVVIGDDSKYY